MIMNKNILPPTSKRVQMNTDPCINNEIKNTTTERLEGYIKAPKEVIDIRMSDLDSEWDTERVLEAAAGSFVLFCSLLGIKKSKLFLLTGSIGFFLIQHALLGWCPTLCAIRYAGIRTAEEIGKERTVLKIIRGDFDQKGASASEMLSTAEK